MADVPEDDKQPSVHDSLSAAFDASVGDVGQEAAQAPQQAAQTPPEGETEEARAERVRDEAGRFAKAPETGQSPPQTPEAGAEPQEAIRPPASWSAAAKADFATLPPHIQQEVMRREKNIEVGSAQWNDKARRLNEYDTVLAPVRDRLSLNGVSEPQYISSLVAADNLLRNDPIRGIAEIARLYGIPAQSLGQVIGQAQTPQDQIPPYLQPLVQEVSALKQSLTAQQQAYETAEKQQALAEVQAFAANPKNTYFENVRPQIAAFIQANPQATLAQAYEAACWAHPEVRPLLIAEQARTQAAAETEKARAKAQAARTAGVSVTGAPGSGSPVGAPSQSVRDTLSDVWDRVA